MENYHRYIYFATLDYAGTPTTTGYALPITPFTFIPIFDDGDSVDYSKQNILWDFGDGTTSKTITASHYYELPGWYTVKCYILGKEGAGYVDAFSQNILIHDYISDSLAIQGVNSKTDSGSDQNPFKVYRFNSLHTHKILSSVGYTINLHSDGNVAPILDMEKYNKDVWAHLKPSCRFESYEINQTMGTYERIPVSKIQTDNNTDIYARVFNNKLELCPAFYDGACLVGTSGSKVVYYIDDIPKDINIIEGEQPINIYASFDTKKFKDLDSNGKNYPDNRYSILNNIYNSNGHYIIIQKINSDHLTITSNGIDDDNNGNLIDSFNIYPQKFIGQKIPFVVKIKDAFEKPSKYNNILQYNTNSNLISAQIYLELRDKKNKSVPNVKFYSNYGVLSTEKYGGYFKGYLIVDKPISDVHIYAKAVPSVSNSTNKGYSVDTTYSLINSPQTYNIYNLSIRNDVKNKQRKIIEQTTFSSNVLSGIYSSCVVSKRLNDGSSIYYAWMVDSDSDKILKYDILNNTVLYDQYVLPENSSPSDICSDRDGNVWVTLYDSVSTIRINNLSNQIDYIIKPSIDNTVTIDHGNTVTPASIDTDTENNIWISYSNPTLSFIEKYKYDGTFLFKNILSPKLESTEIVTDLKGNAWGIGKDTTTNTKKLSSYNDRIYKIDKDGTSLIYYAGAGSLWNLTIDVLGNVWVTKNINEVMNINSNTGQIQTFRLNDKISDSYISDLEGIACTTDNNIIIVDNTNKKLYYFDANIDKYGFLLQEVKIDTELSPDGTVPKIEAYGDWNGFKYINKFQKGRKPPDPIYGKSNTFNIYPSDEGEYEIRKVNENFDMKKQMKSYRFQEYLLNADSVFDGFMGTALGTLSSEPEELSKVIYEKISNFNDNLQNIDTCNIKALQSMYEMLDESFLTFNDTSYNLPARLSRLVDIFSIKYSKLKGSKDKFSDNFDDKGYNNKALRENNQEIYYGFNKGDKLDFFTGILTAGNNIIAFEKYSETYRVLNTDILSSTIGGIQYIDNINRTYNLSSYHPNWGWSLILPDNYNNSQIPLFYDFYEYLVAYSNIQTEGVINWNDPLNTIPDNISTIEELDGIKEKMIYYSLVKGLGIVK